MGAGRQETPLSRSKVAAVVCRMARSIASNVAIAGILLILVARLNGA
jgi:hypothetical protein